MPKLGLRHVIGVSFLAYAAAFNARPDIGSVRYVADSFQLDAAAIVLLYALCGAALIVLPVSPPWIVGFSLPLLLFAVAGFIHAWNDPTTSWIALLGYAVPFTLIAYAAWELAKRGGDGNH